MGGLRANGAITKPFSKDTPLIGPEFVNLKEVEGVTLDLRYTRPDNFTGHAIYGDLREAYLHDDAAEKLRTAFVHLTHARPGWKFLVTEGLRPVNVHQKLWDAVKDTPQEMYVANPLRGSLHSYGLAVDLSLVDESGREVDMGTEIDSFEELAQPRLENQFLAEGRLTATQIQNRMLLRTCMTQAGFLTIPHEWWHFNSVTLEIARQRYRPVP